MTPLGFHITLRLEGDRNLTPDTASRRLFARTVLRVARPFQLLTFRWVDTHGHLETMGSREDAGEVTRRVEIALQLALTPGGHFVPAQFKPMMDLSHVKSTFLYVLGQQQHHGVVVDRFHDGSNGPDLIGARTVGVWTAGIVKQHQPRVTRADILAALGMADPEVFHPEPFGLAEAAAAAIGAPDLTGLDAESRAARCVIAHLVDWPTRMVADALSISESTVRRLRAASPDKAVERAIRQQLAMRQAR